MGREDVGESFDSTSIGRLLGHGFNAGVFKEEVGRSGVDKEEQGLSISIAVSHPFDTQLADSCRAIEWGVCWHLLDLELGSLSVSVDLGMGGFRGRESGGDRGTRWFGVSRSFVGFLIAGLPLSLCFCSQHLPKC